MEYYLWQKHSGHSQTVSINLVGKEIIVGRHTHPQLSKYSLSDRHAIFHAIDMRSKSSEWCIEGTESGCYRGLYVNGQRIDTGLMKLETGDTIGFGSPDVDVENKHFVCFFLKRNIGVTYNSREDDAEVTSENKGVAWNMSKFSGEEITVFDYDHCSANEIKSKHLRHGIERKESQERSYLFGGSSKSPVGNRRIDFGKDFVCKRIIAGIGISGENDTEITSENEDMDWDSSEVSEEIAAFGCDYCSVNEIKTQHLQHGSSSSPSENVRIGLGKETPDGTARCKSFKEYQNAKSSGMITKIYQTAYEFEVGEYFNANSKEKEFHSDLSLTDAEKDLDQYFDDDFLTFKLSYTYLAWHADESSEDMYDTGTKESGKSSCRFLELPESSVGNVGINFGNESHNDTVEDQIAGESSVAPTNLGNTRKTLYEFKDEAFENADHKAVMTDDDESDAISCEEDEELENFVSKNMGFQSDTRSDSISWNCNLNSSSSKHLSTHLHLSTNQITTNIQEFHFGGNEVDEFQFFKAHQ